MVDDSDDEGSGRMADLLTEISGEGTSGLGGSGMEIGSGSGENGSEEDDEEPQELVEVAEDYYYMAHVMRLLAALHSIVSLAMLVAYYHLKVLETRIVTITVQLFKLLNLKIFTRCLLLMKCFDKFDGYMTIVIQKKTQNIYIYSGTIGHL